MKTTIFYYLYDNKGKPAITVCLKKNGSYWARGVAVCNTSCDSPNKSLGKRIAEGRVDHAIKTNKFKRNKIANCGFSYLYSPLADLLPFESELIEKINGKEEVLSV